MRVTELYYITSFNAIYRSGHLHALTYWYVAFHRIIQRLSLPNVARTQMPRNWTWIVRSSYSSSPPCSSWPIYYAKVELLDKKKKKKKEEASLAGATRMKHGVVTRVDNSAWCTARRSVRDIFEVANGVIFHGELLPLSVFPWPTLQLNLTIHILVGGHFSEKYSTVQQCVQVQPGSFVVSPFR